VQVVLRYQSEGYLVCTCIMIKMVQYFGNDENDGVLVDDAQSETTSRVKVAMLHE
jgi:hypothetical protein